VIESDQQVSPEQEGSRPPVVDADAVVGSSGAPLERAELQRRRNRRKVITAVSAVMLLAAALSVVAVVEPGAGPRPPAGRLLSLDAGGAAVLSKPDATRPGPAVGSTSGELIASRDSRYVASSTATGAHVTPVQPRGLGSPPQDIRFPNPASNWILADFADNDRALIVTQLAGQLEQVAAASLNETTSHGSAPGLISFGTAASAVGDPRSVGVIAAVGVESSAFQVNDTDLELRDLAQPPIVLATASRLAGAVGLPPGGNIGLIPLAAPDGGRIAVTVSGDGGASQAGIAILDRRGHLLGAVTTNPDALIAFPAWSPDGRSLVYATYTTDLTYKINIWKVGQQPHLRYEASAASAPGNTIGGACLWAADDSGVLCETSNGSPHRWIIINPAGGPARKITADLTPTAWLR
jgi:hypothetical protein